MKPKSTNRKVAVLFGDPRKNENIPECYQFSDVDSYTIEQLKLALLELKDYEFIYLDNHDTLIADLKELKDKIDYVFNLCDEGYLNQPQNEQYIPVLLEILKIPYTGAGPSCLDRCYDKSLVRGIAQEMNIPVARALYMEKLENIYSLPLSFPVIVKPNFGDSSFGIRKNNVVYEQAHLIEPIQQIWNLLGHNEPILIEEFLPGNDISIGIIGNSPDSYHVLPVTEEDYSVLPKDLPKIRGYEAKWLPNSCYGKVMPIPAQISQKNKDIIVNCSLRLYERLACRDYCRLDWRLDAHDCPCLLEMNPNPGWGWDGHMVLMANLENISYSGMLLSILQAAEKRLGLESGTKEPSPEYMPAQSVPKID